MEYNLYTDDGDEWDDDYDPYEDEDYVDNSSENDLFAPPSSKPVNKGESYRWN